MRLLLLALILLLSACATVPPAAPPERVDDFSAHLARLQALDAWTLRGRVAVTTPDDSGTLSVGWQQVGEAYRIELRGPFGAGAVRLTGDVDGVRLQTARGEEAFAEEPGELLEHYTGYRLPVEALRYWLLGAPVPDILASRELDANGLLDQLGQLGWQVDYRDYGQFGDIALPTRVFLKNGEGIRVRLVVQAWEFGG